MRRYSAGEAIGPAWEHTKTLLWRDTGIAGADGVVDERGGFRGVAGRRNWGRLLKLCLVAIGAEFGGLNLHYNGPFTRHTGQVPAFSAAMAVGALIIGGFALAVALLLAYLGSRLQLAQFDFLVLRDPIVAPAWRRHGHHTWRWLGLKATALAGTCLVLSPLLIPAIPIVAAILRETSRAGSPAHIHWPAMLALVLELLVLVFLALVVIRFVDGLLLPGVAIEDLRFGPALRRAWDLFRSDVSGMLLFAVLQPVLLFLLGMGTSLGMAFAVAVIALPFGVAGLLLWFTLHTFLLGKIVFGFFVGLAVLAVLAAALLLYIAVAGTLLTFSRAWSLFFIGGRYPLLGQYLEPGAAVPVWTPPPSHPRDDNSGGPDFPADPALA